MKYVILVLFVLASDLSQGQSIQEFYESFTHSRRKTTQKSEKNQVLIDEKNAFIKIYNPQDEDDGIIFKCFVKEDKSRVFGFQYSASQPDLGLFMTRTEFYTYVNNEWKDVTFEVCPSISFKDFWGNQTLPHSSLQEFNLHLLLLQQGTNLVAKSTPAVKVQFPYDNLPKEYSSTFEKRKFKTIELKWNTATGKFQIAKKY